MPIWDDWDDPEKERLRRAAEGVETPPPAAPPPPVAPPPPAPAGKSNNEARARQPHNVTMIKWLILAALLIAGLFVAKLLHIELHSLTSTGNFWRGFLNILFWTLVIGATIFLAVKAWKMRSWKYALSAVGVLFLGVALSQAMAAWSWLNKPLPSLPPSAASVPPMVQAAAPVAIIAQCPSPITITKEWSAEVKVPLGYYLVFDRDANVGFEVMLADGTRVAYPRDIKDRIVTPVSKTDRFRILAEDPAETVNIQFGCPPVESNFKDKA